MNHHNDLKQMVQIKAQSSPLYLGDFRKYHKAEIEKHDNLEPEKKTKSINAEHLYDHAMRVLTGVGVRCNYSAAIELFNTAASMGHHYAGLMSAYRPNRRFNIPESIQLRYNKYKNSSTIVDSSLQHALGQCYFSLIPYFETDHKKSTFWFTKAAEQNHPDAQYQLGRACECGHGITKNSKLAAYWYNQSAELGHIHAQCKISEFLRHGIGIQQNDSMALYWIVQASQAGDRTAQYDLGMCYLEGTLGCEMSYGEAVYWFEQSQANGAPNEWVYASYELAKCYFYGLGVRRDPAMAKKIFQAAHKSDQDADKAYLGDLFDKLYRQSE